MKWFAVALRVLVGLPFVVFGLNHFLNFMPPPPSDGLPDAAKSLGGVLTSTGWMNVVKVLEVTGGLLLLSGRLTPLGIVVLMPVAVNILLWDVLIMDLKQPPLGVVLTALLALLMIPYRSYFLPFVRPTATIGAA